MDNERISQKFKKVYRELDSLNAKIDVQDGWFLFKSHRYTIEELLESSNHQRILTISAKIGDDIQNWKKNNNLDSEEEESYFAHRENIEDILHELNLKIEDREPTLWEHVQVSLETFTSFVMENLPDTLIESFFPALKNRGMKLLRLVLKR